MNGKRDSQMQGPWTSILAAAAVELSHFNMVAATKDRKPSQRVTKWLQNDSPNVTGKASARVAKCSHSRLGVACAEEKLIRTSYTE
jgi:hypothetical protein